MNGIVDHRGRALLNVSIRPTEDGLESPIDVWVDTGFTGDLILPRQLIEQLGLRESSVVKAAMGDGRQAEMDTFRARINWFGEDRDVEVIVSTGQNTLLGVRLMLGRRLVVDYGALAGTKNGFVTRTPL